MGGLAFGDPGDFTRMVIDHTVRRRWLGNGKEQPVEPVGFGEQLGAGSRAARLVVTLKRYHRVDERHVELHPKSTNPEHTPIRFDLQTDPFEIAGMAVGALIGDGFNPPEYDCSAG